VNADVRNRIREFIRQELLYGDSNATLEDETPLLENVMDSLGLMQLVAFLEQEFDVEIDDGEITTDNFQTIASIEGLVTSRVGQA